MSNAAIAAVPIEAQQATRRPLCVCAADRTLGRETRPGTAGRRRRSRPEPSGRGEQRQHDHHQDAHRRLLASPAAVLAGIGAGRPPNI
jgi:hypothetical protein